SSRVSFLFWSMSHPSRVSSSVGFTTNILDHSGRPDFHSFFSEVWDRLKDDRTVLTVCRKPLKRLIKHSLLMVTSLKRGVNERTQMKRRFLLLVTSLVAALSITALAFAQWKPTISEDDRMRGSYRFDRNGWIYVHLEGSPEQI